MRSLVFTQVAVFALLAGTVGTAASARAEVLGQYDIPATAASAFSVAGSPAVSGLTFSDLTRGSGLAATGNAGTFTSLGFSFSTTDAEAAQAAGDYLEFTLTPGAGSSFSLESLTYTDSATIPGPGNIVVRSSADGFLSSLTAYGTTTAGTDRTVSLSGVDFTGIMSALTFRIIGFNANNPNSGSVYALQSNPLVVRGTMSNGSTVTANAEVAPEPGSLALAALGVLPLLGVLRARRRK